MTVPARETTPNIALKLRFPILHSVPGKDDSIDFRLLRAWPIQKECGNCRKMVSQFRDYAVSTTPLGRVGTADDIASAALFLASDDSRWITGEEILVGGGIRLEGRKMVREILRYFSVAGASSE